jgi:hypothetical protein
LIETTGGGPTAHGEPGPRPAAPSVTARVRPASDLPMSHGQVARRSHLAAPPGGPKRSRRRLAVLHSPLDLLLIFRRAAGERRHCDSRDNRQVDQGILASSFPFLSRSKVPGAPLSLSPPATTAMDEAQGTSPSHLISLSRSMLMIHNLWLRVRIPPPSRSRPRIQALFLTPFHFVG